VVVVPVEMEEEMKEGIAALLVVAFLALHCWPQIVAKIFAIVDKFDVAAVVLAWMNLLAVAAIYSVTTLVVLALDGLIKLDQLN
jgi:hypothetical protein